ncbi:hypothetical protein CspeluHIS016_0801770 [Cutaneotrichosporon spelunceum]|uniref:Uncharacterized protein n=1 Tax=Cutaneotrichosporon spelunceum TaxID=1672016 RepID=A0AAD3YDW6_9TREE|nr:hypothetical protein CspeluHIS016_0801770 [Cutaneotrichosporon spelunceum]
MGSQVEDQVAAAQRKADKGNPDSLSIDPSRREQVRDKPHFKPPLADVSMGRFLTYLTLGLVALVVFYVWSSTVGVKDAGGYWNLVTSRHDTNAEVVQNAATKAHEQDTSSTSAAAAKDAGTCPPCDVPDATVESLVLQLADKLGVKPSEINAVIRPLIDPSAPKVSTEPTANEPGLLGVLGEVLLD